MSEPQQTPGRQVATILESNEFKAKIQQALPPNVSLDRFTRATITAIQKNPGILEGDKQSLYSSISEAAAAGLQLDGKEAALVIYNTNVGTKEKPRWIKKVQYMPMVAGIIKNLARMGFSVDSEVVYAKDSFHVVRGDDPKITHTPVPLGDEQGEAVGVYAIIKHKDGTVFREIMTKAQVEEVRAVSKQPNSLMWDKFWTEGWRKAVVRRCAKRIPYFDDYTAKTVEADDATFTMDSSEDLEAVDPQTVVSTQESPPETPPKPRARPRALQAVVDHKQTSPPPADAEAPALVDTDDPGPQPEDVF